MSKPEGAATGEAVRDLARKIEEAIWEKQSGFPTAKAEELIQAALEPLLSAARDVCDIHGEKHPSCVVHRLANELARFERLAE